MEFSVIDIETTGFSKKKDRILEIAIIRINNSGEVLHSFESLINPQRDVGPSHIHGVTATTVVNAPLFSDVAPYIVDLLNNSTLVSHNKNFDLGFLKSELNRSGFEITNIDGLCTLNMSKYLFPELPSRKLEVLCEYLDVLVENAHQAYDDCLATAELFLKMYDTFIQEIGKTDFYDHFLKTNIFSESVSQPIQKIEFRRLDAIESLKQEESKLKSLLNRIPDTYKAADYNISEYLNLLDRILEDRIITDEELLELEQYASSYQISPQDLTKIHHEYFRRLVRFYLADNELSQTELLDLEKVAKLLQIESEEKDSIINLESADLVLNEKTESDNCSSFVGKSVCFTGQLISKMHGEVITRELAHELAIEKGIVVKKGVSKSLDALVVADPNTQSSKGKKARQYGVRIIAEPVFWRDLGIHVE